MKSEIYNALAALNSAFDVALESLTILQHQGVVSADYVQRQREIAEEVRAGMNSIVLNKLQTREVDDREHYGKMRSATEAQMKSS